MAKIEPRQITLIKIAQKDLGIEDADYRALLTERYWVDSCTRLSQADADDLIKHFMSLGFVKKKPKKKRARKPLRAPGIAEVLPSNHAMVGKINHLIEDIKWNRPGGQSGYINKIIQKPWPRTVKEGQKVIEALKGLKATQQRRAG